FADARRAVVERYNEGLKDLPVILPPQAPAGDVHPWHLYVLRLQPGARLNRDALIDALFKDGIGVSVHYIPLHLHPYWRERYELRAEAFPRSQQAYEQMLSLPLYSRMTAADADRVIATLRRQLG
ncbi:MAG: DegT/DnrJ/EryC1/StrS family aminotransferase, partial [Inhella sp.]